ncbi:unnamed protein product [Allacma fusca]|uniref:Uncharacterized protein n=1 Tax=Allacma fusca TaxID=39272 RepID=A0A8J2PTA1_9HEXA|nr:unnamed protein product [Allacma fusca]
MFGGSKQQHFILWLFSQTLFFFSLLPLRFDKRFPASSGHGNFLNSNHYSLLFTVTREFPGKLLLESNHQFLRVLAQVRNKKE